MLLRAKANTEVVEPQNTDECWLPPIAHRKTTYRIKVTFFPSFVKCNISRFHFISFFFFCSVYKLSIFYQSMYDFKSVVFLRFRFEQSIQHIIFIRSLQYVFDNFSCLLKKCIFFYQSSSKDNRYDTFSLVIHQLCDRSSYQYSVT